MENDEDRFARLQREWHIRGLGANGIAYRCHITAHGMPKHRAFAGEAEAEHIGAGVERLLTQ